MGTDKMVNKIVIIEKIYKIKSYFLTIETDEGSIDSFLLNPKVV